MRLAVRVSCKHWVLFFPSDFSNFEIAGSIMCTNYVIIIIINSLSKLTKIKIKQICIYIYIYIYIVAIFYVVEV